MSELALYRKYRSKTFDEVVGQPHVVATLKNAVAAGRISHAYLLTGQRGVGKTSVARILARSLNCLSDGEKPCNSCTNCTAAINGNLDIIEIDAASNRGIDEMRDLKEKINLAPSLGKYKVYIIDEVHMLTDAAFNALLKTLEEPPAHAVFILATTEAHKLPATIISRTQRFNFHQVDASVISSHITMVAAREDIGVNAEALEMIAGASGGSFRDALSLLDQVSAFGGEVTAEEVRQLLGWGNDEEIIWLYQAIIDDQLALVLGQIDQLYENGAQPEQIIDQLTSVVRDDLRKKLVDGEPTAQQLALLESLITASKSALPQYALEVAIAAYRQSGKPTASGANSAKAAATSTVAAPSNVAAPERISSKADQPIPAQPPSSTVTETTPVKLSQTEPPNLTSFKSEHQQAQGQAKAPAAQTAETKTQDGQASTPKGDQVDDFDILWMKALANIKAQNNSLYALLCSCDAQSTDSGIDLMARFSFHRDRIVEPKNLQIIEQAAAKAFGRELQVKAKVTAQADPKPADTAGELVSSALEILGGEVVE